jgi:hypothetical protein
VTPGACRLHVDDALLAALTAPTIAITSSPVSRAALTVAGCCRCRTARSHRFHAYERGNRVAPVKQKTSVSNALGSCLQPCPVPDQTWTQAAKRTSRVLRPRSGRRSLTPTPGGARCSGRRGFVLVRAPVGGL